MSSDVSLVHQFKSVSYYTVRAQKVQWIQIKINTATVGINVNSVVLWNRGRWLRRCIRRPWSVESASTAGRAGGRSLWRWCNRYIVFVFSKFLQVILWNWLYTYYLAYKNFYQKRNEGHSQILPFIPTNYFFNAPLRIYDPFVPSDGGEYLWKNN